ncbi:hypothetical protein PG993_001937 [Apiospora rasikravindrae]|uniref:Uncharacterized protein n=1 Tax=Apiospora rasikravindrae TaxID=990691 RepID=A0ABR1UCT4_9PEZI
MCIKLSVHYKGCNCLRESLSPCPTFQKKRSGFWGSLFGAFKHEKHCGKVRRSRQQADSICDDCAIKARGLRPHRVGDGANLPRRKVADESFRKERPDGGRRSPKRKRRSGGRKRHSGHSQYSAIPTNAKAWIPNLYDETKQLPLAPPPEYGRKYAPAPPRLKDSGAQWPPPDMPLPPLPRQTRAFAQHTAAESSSGSRRGGAPSYSRPVRPEYYTRQRPAVPPAPFSGMKKQEAFTHPLRREQRHVQRHPPPPLKIRPPERQPLYMECLQEQNSEMAQRYGSRRPLAPLPTPTMKPKPAEASKGSKLRDFKAALGFESSDSDSDVSFACVDARKVEAGQSVNPMANPYHAAPRRR